MSDYISRQAAIEALEQIRYALWEIDIPSPTVPEYIEHHCDVQNVMKRIDEIRDKMERLPSGQPEIIRCTECKHYREYDSKYVENAVVVQCMADRYPISEIIPDGWFCAGAERKDDE